MRAERIRAAIEAGGYSAVSKNNNSSTGILYGNELRRDPDRPNSYFPAEYVREQDGEVVTVPERLLPPDNPDDMLYDNRTTAYKCFNLPDNHAYKRRIPPTSVVYRVSDYRQCFICDYTTAARTINWSNVISAIFMLVLLIVTIDVGFLRAGKLDTNVRIQRLSGGWNFTLHNETTLADLDEFWGLKDQDTPVSLAGMLITILCIELFMLLLEITWASFERFWYIYHRQLDDAFAYWRWFHWCVADALLVVTVAMVMGIREFGLLGCFFVLTWTCFALGFVNELYSRPRFKADEKIYGYPVGNNPKVSEINVSGRKAWKVNYDRDANALKIISQDAWEGDRPLWDDNRNRLEDSNELIEAQRLDNYWRRMLPYTLGWVPGLTPWLIMSVQYFRHRLDLQDMVGAPVDYQDWRIVFFFGCAMLSWSKALIQLIFQYLPPTHYWGSELLAIWLNLALKAYFALLLLYNVIGADVDTEAVLQRYQI